MRGSGVPPWFSNVWQLTAAPRRIYGVLPAFNGFSDHESHVEGGTSLTLTIRVDRGRDLHPVPHDSDASRAHPFSGTGRAQDNRETEGRG